MRADEIQKLLEVKHAQDVYVPECKNGPSYGGLSILDGWAMKKSWAHPMVTGYEIKVSRSDFLRDTKYHEYAAYCNCMFLVAPQGVLNIEEVPENFGYYQVASTGNRLLTKKKAPYQDHAIPEEIYRYILMTRAKIVSSRLYYHDQESKKAFFEEWLQERKINRALGYQVSKALAETIDKRIIQVEEENGRLQHENEKLREVREVMSELGVKPNAWHPQDEFRRKFDERINGERNRLEGEIANGIQVLRFLAEQIKQCQ